MSALSENCQSLTVDTDRADRIFRLIFRLLIVSTVVGCIPNVLRLMGDEYGWIGHYPKAVNTILMCLAVIALSMRAKGRVDAFLVLATLLIPFGAVVGALHGEELRYFMSHLYFGVFAVLMYAVGYNSNLSRTELRNWISDYSRYATAVYAVVMVVYLWLVVYAQKIAFMGLSPNELILPFAFYLVMRRRWPGFLIMMIVILSGKRGVLMAVVAEYIVYALPGRSLTAKMLLTVGLLAGLFIALCVLLPYVNTGELSFGIQGIIDKWELLNPFNEKFDLAVGSSTRSSEVSESFPYFAASFWNWIVGMGYGWKYFNTELIPGVETYNYYRHYVHLSPLNYLYVYGLPLAIIFLGSIWYKLEAAHRWFAALYGKHSIGYVLVIYMVGALTVGLTAYSYSVDPVMWILFGCLSSCFWNEKASLRHGERIRR